MQRPGSLYGHDLIPINTATGNPLAPLDSDPAVAGYTLVASTTYVYDVGSRGGAKEAPYQSVHVMWDAAAILTITIEDTNFDSNSVSVASLTKGQWIQENPSTAYISVASTDGTTGGATVTNAAVAVAGGTAGGCMIHLGFVGSLRTRVKIVVGGTGGVVRVAQNMKD